MPVIFASLFLLLISWSPATEVLAVVDVVAEAAAAVVVVVVVVKGFETDSPGELSLCSSAFNGIHLNIDMEVSPILTHFFSLDYHNSSEQINFMES